MFTILKFLLIFIFTLTEVFSLLFSVMIPGFAVSRSGCGIECMDNVSILQTIGIESLILAFIIYFIHFSRES